MKGRQWCVRALDKEAASWLSEEMNIPSFLAMLLVIRGYDTPEKAAGLLEEEEELPFDPFLLRDMDKAADHLLEAMDRGEKIAVFGDYDADGVTATALLTGYLRGKGADVLPYIPEREGEGYGMNEEAVRTLARQGVSLIVTVDNGIAGEKEIRLAGELGMRVIVTDHHRVQGELPPALAVVDPQREDEESPYRDFSGVGLAYQLAAAVESGESDPEETLRPLLDLVAVGTVGDVVPLTGENRRLVRRGLQVLREGARPGLCALLEEAGAAGKALVSQDLAYTLVPRINAAGRMDSPRQALELLLSGDEEEAQVLAQAVNTANTRRREVEAGVQREALLQLQREPRRLYARVVIVEGENWFPGVIGIVAARLTELTGKPCIVLSCQGDEARGSGRSVEGFSLFEAVHACRDSLLKYGGHPMAAGLSLKREKIPEFSARMEQWARGAFPQMPVPRLTLDCRLRPEAVSLELPEQMERLEPFGEGNPPPLFGLFRMTLRQIVPVGGGKHLRLMLEKDGCVLPCMRFGVSESQLGYQAGDCVDAAVSLSRNEFRGQESVTVQIHDLRPAGEDPSRFVRQAGRFEKLGRGEALDQEEKEELRCQRSEFAQLYRFLREKGGWNSSSLALWRALKQPALPFSRLLLMCEVMRERGLIRFSYLTGRIALCPVQGKTDLMASKILQALE